MTLVYRNFMFSAAISAGQFPTFIVMHGGAREPSVHDLEQTRKKENKMKINMNSSYSNQ